MYVAYHEALMEAVAGVLDTQLKSFEEDFAPVPPPAEQPAWEAILLTVLSLAGTIGVSSFCNGGTFLKIPNCFIYALLLLLLNADLNLVLKALPAFAKGGSPGPVAYDNYKDAAKAFMSFGASLTGEVTKPQPNG